MFFNPGVRRLHRIETLEFTTSSPADGVEPGHRRRRLQAHRSIIESQSRPGGRSTWHRAAPDMVRWRRRLWRWLLGDLTWQPSPTATPGCSFRQLRERCASTKRTAHDPGWMCEPMGYPPGRWATCLRRRLHRQPDRHHYLPEIMRQIKAT